MRHLKIGVVGAGVIGRKHLEVAAAASSPVRAVGVADIREESARDAASRFGVERVYGGADELFADPKVEAVVLAVPTAGRAELALRAIAAGKHVLIEKPAAMNAAEIDTLIKAQASAEGRIVVGCCTSRFSQYGSAAFVREQIAGGALGDLRMLRLREIWPAGEAPSTVPPAWRLSKALNGGGILMNWGCYDLDYLLSLAGWRLKPARVMAQTWRIAPHLAARAAPGSDGETHVAALIVCEGGETIALERGEQTAAAKDAVAEAIGTHGSLQFKISPERGKRIVRSDADSRRGVSSAVVWTGDEDFDQGNRAVLHDFAEAVLGGRQPCTDLAKSLLVQRTIDAIYQSAETHRCVEIGG